ncbi:MAG: UDP-N-acetylmuramoyl-L-alanyl-D-glutamate--2,6-diaminopimelate ligase [Acidimicrobiales bacterium]|jgi:UDP-N-acetylmuramoyl-L-alanyl-D-glutamate--2,6-diaminopimelate ligase|nr:UDP-N-acetylmuramoyl-L-alanyl-D-glutamate--2,6-diaminopimelate ligase [Acidimicrobiales bacterium]HJM28095.1 UDP-N-acetylmuramoyl-L-alanyl-D-glutamate--2,6-diaminopimelate ligase [Acidimicrobiales bacterium]HJM96634.1 UDP-N-acetylmuramoyl-L-alanyl-D-glutamate--2,6-diaminopimelate ligase [Acidimicrobiales bacterium]
MRLEEIVDALEIAQNTTIPLDESQNGVLVNGLSYDSRNTKIGDLFFCVSGNTQDGHDFASHAVENGASVLVVERNLELQTPQVKVRDVRSAMAEISEIFFNFPSKELVTAGITGTNGKTTTVNLLADIAASADQNSATIGTLTGTRTTPEAPDLQRQIRELVDAGKSFLSMEVSSHALSQRRISNIKYDVAVFTNLSLDHLDFHGDMETYFQAKALLFTPAHAKYAVINVDSPYGQRLAEGIEIPHRTISMDEIEILHESIRASVFIWEGEKIELQIPGTFNMENALAAAVTAQVLGFEKSSIVKGLSEAQAIPGRFEVVNLDENGPTVIVDYSHTPEGLRKVLESAKSISASGEVHVVFGCGGDRDKSKRPQMAEVSEGIASFVYLTSDNPRSEDQLSIIDDVIPGFTDFSDVYVEPDRRKAILHAIQTSEKKDVIVVAGKGDEVSQEISGEFFPLDDREIVLEGLEARLK